MEFRIRREGEDLGLFTLEEVARGVGDGKFWPEDQIASQDEENWKPLNEVLDFPSSNEAGLALPPDQTTFELTDESFLRYRSSDYL